MEAYPSSWFEFAIGQSHTVWSQCDFYTPGTYVVGGDNTPLMSIYSFNIADTDPAGQTLCIVDGQVTYDKNSDIRATLTLKIVDPYGGLVPTGQWYDPIAPWGSIIVASIGVAMPDVETEATSPIPESPVWPQPINQDTMGESVPMGVFRISQVEVKVEKGAPTLNITAYDLSRIVQRNQVQLYWPPSLTGAAPPLPPLVGLQYPGLIQAIIASRYPDANFTTTWEEWALGQPIPGLVVPALGPGTFSEGTDMWNQSRQYAQACGCDLFCNRLGQFEYYVDPSYEFMTGGVSSVVATFAVGDKCYFDAATGVLDDAQAFNIIIVFGEETTLEGPLISIPYVDSDPLSATYFGTQPTEPLSDGMELASEGPYGAVVNVVTNNLLTTQDQCNDFAKIQFCMGIGKQQTMTVDAMVCNPCLDVDDVVEMTIPQATGIYVPPEINPELSSVWFIIDQIVHPMVPNTKGSMKLRQQRNLEGISA